eukprot:Nk52_evm31s1360 gene=Nk52_evmTU31s1360
MLGITVQMVRGATRRIRYTGKWGNKQYYKGVGCKPTGYHKKNGGYQVLPNRVPAYIVPDMTDCKLKPYLPKNLEAPKVNPPTKDDYLKLMIEQHKRQMSGSA